MSKQTKRSDAEVAPAEQVDWSQYAEHSGYESVTQQDLGIPFLAIIQKGSPEVDEDHEDHATKKIANSKVGCIFNTTSRELVYTPGAEPLQFIAVYFKKMYVEWAPNRGGIVHSHTDSRILEQTTKDEDGRDVLKNGNTVVTTAYFFGYYLNESGERIRSVIGMSSTQLKKSRSWLNLMHARKIPGTSTPFPMYAQVFNLGTVGESNAKGSWRGWTIESSHIISDRALLDEGKNACAAVQREQLPALEAPKADTDSDEVPY